MNNFTTKFRLIFIPFIIIALATVGIYTFLHWLLLIKCNFFVIDEHWVACYIPMGVIAVTLIIWLYPRLKLTGNATGEKYLLMAAFATILVTTFMAQTYLDVATGKLTKLDHISQIDKLPKTKYYEVKHFCIDKRELRLQTIFNVSGKRNENFEMSMYVVVPIFDQEDSMNTSSKLPIVPPAWLTLKYHKTISNKLSPEEKEVKYKSFMADCQIDFDASPMERFVYLDRIRLSKDKKNYLEAVKSEDSTIADALLLTPVYEPFGARLSHKLPRIFGAFGIGSVVFLMILLFIRLKDTTNEEPFEAIRTELSDEIDFKNIFKEGYNFTLIIIALNLLIYIAMILTGLGFITFNGADLLKWGANYRPAIENGAYWRLLTSMFLHGGLWHIACNVYGLIAVGLFLEPLIGSTRYLIAYLVTGILASITSVWWYPATVSIGASGAIFGMYGILLALLTTNLFPSTLKKSSLINTAIFVGYNLLHGLTGGIDNAAHIGGLISGLLIGYALYPFLKQHANYEDAEDES